MQMQTLRRRVFDVTHIKIQPTAVEEKAAIARRFLIVAIMQVDRAGISFAEKIIFHLRRPKLKTHVRLVFTEKTAVLGLNSNDSIHSDQITRRMATWLSENVPSPSSSPQNRERRIA